MFFHLNELLFCTKYFHPWNKVFVFHPFESTWALRFFGTNMKKLAWKSSSMSNHFDYKASIDPTCKLVLFFGKKCERNENILCWKTSCWFCPKIISRGYDAFLPWISKKKSQDMSLRKCTLAAISFTWSTD